MTWTDLSTPGLFPAQLGQMVAILAQPVPVATAPGGPALGWVDALRVVRDRLQAAVRWLGALDSSCNLARLIVEPNAVNVETGVHIGARLAGCIAGAIDPYTALLSRHAADLADNDNDDPSPPQETNTMDFADRIYHRAALSIQAKRECTYPEALQLARDAGQRPLPARAPLALDPPMPIMAGKPGEAHSNRSVLSHSDARTHLEAHMSGYDSLTYDHQHRAAVALCGLVNQGEQRKLLSAKPANGKSTVLLCLYPGATRFQRLRAYLAATVHGWADFGHAEQHTRTLAARTQFNTIDAAQVAA